MTEHLGAETYERTDERAGYRNGYKPRTLITAVGDLHLLVPQDRAGTFSTSLFERYQRTDKALVLSLMEMYLKGVSTRKVAAVTEKLCGRSFSSQLVSKLSKQLDEKLKAWRERSLDEDYPYLLIDARLREGQGMRKGDLPTNLDLRGDLQRGQERDTGDRDRRHRVRGHLVRSFSELKEKGAFGSEDGNLRRP